MEVIFILGCWALWTACCYSIAKGKNLNTNIAIGSGLIFGVFAVIYYIILPAGNTNEQ